MEWKGYKYILEDLYKNIEVSQTINMKEVWKKDCNPDKRLVITQCPNCLATNHPLLQPDTKEFEHKRTPYRSHYRERIDKIIYAVICNKCEEKYKFKLICDSFMYAKLGQY